MPTVFGGCGACGRGWVGREGKPRAWVVAGLPCSSGHPGRQAGTKVGSLGFCLPWLPAVLCRCAATRSAGWRRQRGCERRLATSASTSRWVWGGCARTLLTFYPFAGRRGGAAAAGAAPLTCRPPKSQSLANPPHTTTHSPCRSAMCRPWQPSVPWLRTTCRTLADPSTSW